MQINKLNKKHIFITIILVGLVGIIVGIVALRSPITIKKEAQQTYEIECQWTLPPADFYVEIQLLDHDKNIVRPYVTVQNDDKYIFTDISSELALDGAYCSAKLIRESDQYVCYDKDSYGACTIGTSPTPTPVLSPTPTIKSITPSATPPPGATETPTPPTTPTVTPLISNTPSPTPEFSPTPISAFSATSTPIPNPTSADTLTSFITTTPSPTPTGVSIVSSLSGTPIPTTPVSATPTPFVGLPRAGVLPLSALAIGILLIIVALAI